MSLARKIAAWTVVSLFAGAYAALAGACLYASAWLFLNASLGGALFWTAIFLAVLGGLAAMAGQAIWGED